MPEPKQSPDGPASAPATTTETLAAVLADYRADIPAMTSGELPHPTPEYLRILLDRIEAAAERERAELHRQLRNEIQINNALATVRPQLHYVDDVMAESAKERAHEIELAKLSAPGNAAALREALEDTNRLLKHYAECIPMFADAFAQHIRDNDAALKGETK